MTKLIAALLGFGSMLSGCAMLPSFLPPATDLRGTETQVVVVGKFELVPPFNPKLEQKTHWNVIGDKRILNRIVMATGATLKPANTDSLFGPDWQGIIEAEWDVPFMVKAPRQRTYLNGGFVQLDLLSSDKLWFPGGYYFEVPHDARAIYIGTLRFTRNEFNRITNIEIIDERKDLGSQINPSVRQSLLKKAK